MRGIAVAAAITASLAMQAAVAWKVCEKARALAFGTLMLVLMANG